jgi:hypothetical protein
VAKKDAEGLLSRDSAATSYKTTAGDVTEPAELYYERQRREEALRFMTPRQTGLCVLLISILGEVARVGPERNKKAVTVWRDGLGEL